MSDHAPDTIRFEQPIVILSAPRSGSTLLFETLARAKGVHTIGGESHRVIEGMPVLSTASRGYDSNRLEAADAPDDVIGELRARFGQALRDRGGRQPEAGESVRFLEKTPKNILRIPFMREVFPGVKFVVLFRDPRAVLSSMMEAWRSGHFVTYPRLPEWHGLPWSLLLVPGWQRMSGRPLEEVVAYQWACATYVMLKDLEDVPEADWLPIRYEDLVADPARQVDGLCQWLDVEWDEPLHKLPLSRFTLSAPSEDKWRQNEAAILRVMPLVQQIQAQVDALLARRASA